jgi:hypothetical protein
MRRSALRAALRGAGLLAAGSGCGAGAWALARQPLLVVARPVLADGLSGLDSLPFDVTLLAVCAALLLGCTLWLLVTTTVALTAYLAQEIAPHGRSTAPLRRAAERTCPPAVRRFVAAALGVAMTAGVAAAPALAAPEAGSHRLAGPDRLAGLALPDRPTGSAPALAGQATLAPRTAPPHEAGSRPAGRLVVRTGQSLWSICVDRLPSTATDAEITHAWHRLHHANAVRIGPDPDLILPGTRLVVPDRTAAPHREEAP